MPKADVEQRPIVKTLLAQFEKALKRGYRHFYVTVDLHDTLLKSNYSAKELPTEMYDYSEECLQLMTLKEDFKLIMDTSSPEDHIIQYDSFFKERSIVFDYFGENPEQSNTDYASFDDKYYFNLRIEDKAGFNPEKDWKPLLEAIKLLPKLTGPQKTFDIASTVMRIQSPLGVHDGHLAVLDEMFNGGKKVMIFLAVDPGGPSHRNPLPYDERAALLKVVIDEKWEDRNYSILPFINQESNEFWSHDLDSAIKAHAQMPGLSADQVAYFQSRDGFGKHYMPHGMFSMVNVPEIPGKNATSIRMRSVTHRTITPDYVKGMVAQQMKRPEVELLAQTRTIIKNAEGKFGIIKYLSSNEKKYRFVGGYVSGKKDASYGASAERKFSSKLICEDRSKFTFVRDIPFSDWRYREAGTRIICTVFKITVRGEISINPDHKGPKLIDLKFVDKSELREYLSPEEWPIIDLIK